MTYPSDASSTYRSDPSEAYTGSVAETPAGFGAGDSSGSDYGSDAGSDYGSDSSTTEVAKEQAAAVSGTAAQAGQQVAGVAKDEAANVVQQAKYEARNLLDQTRTELSSQASTQQQRAASGLHSLSAELQSMASKSESDGPATQVARQAADRVESAASWLENREPGQVITEIQRFARQRPGAFLAMAAGAGVLVGRLGRGIAADSSASSGSTGQTQPAMSSVPDYGWQQTGTAAHGTELDPALAYETPPASTQLLAEPVPPLAEGDYYPATDQTGYPATAEGGYPQSGEGEYPAPGTGIGR